jgi:hypothetical protein
VGWQLTQWAAIRWAYRDTRPSIIHSSAVNVKRIKVTVFWSIALMMEAASTSETSVNFYQTTRRYNPEDGHLHTRRLEKLKSYYVVGCIT